MTMYYKPQNPGVMLETGFGQECLGANMAPLSKLTLRVSLLASPAGSTTWSWKSGAILKLRRKLAMSTPGPFSSNA